MEKITDFLLKAFMWTYSLLFCSIALPVALGLLWLIGEIAFSIREYFDRFGVWQYFIFLIVGVFIKILWFDRRVKERDKK